MNDASLDELWALFGERWATQYTANLAYCDLRDGACEFGHVFRRCWSSRGLRVVPASGSFSVWLSSLDPARELVALVEQDQDCLELDQLFERDAKIIVRATDGISSHAGNELVWNPNAVPVLGRSTQLRVEGANTLRRNRCDLPVEIEVSVPSCGPSQRVLRIASSSSYATDLPTPLWICIDGPPSGKLVIDIEPMVDGDAWKLVYAGSRRNVQVVPAPDQHHRGFHLEHLALVFDRTCPDTQSWARAYAWSRRGPNADHYSSLSPALQQSEWGGAEQPNTVDPEDFNSEIRRTLGRALAEVLDPEVPVDAWAVKDSHERSDVVVELTRRSGSELAHAFEPCTYSTGIDLFDPIERGLECAIERLENVGAGSAAVLIVGNSPPTVSFGPGKIRNLLEFPGYRTFPRFETDLWASVLRRCEEQEVRVVYVFLEHAFRPGELDVRSHDYNRAMTLSNKVALALESDVELVRAQADEPGLRAGIEDALALLARPPKSKVRLRR
ncbi:hypothetical protein G6O69_18475 [Pseudenhygromyxa sp. WMMC2535]|uniref:hypothetical protein n=1 Tax=Pseudenhygromyxa sp. WMMC2535 TaxID=2712867 RepID=UPI0015951000|nr:hypothetical protein [Pseudenhygromyxa sp. WMMC2535]NVB39835.1 hypothetical protein [Pseudenhygromyxa sp. WMMC2535]